MFKAAQIVKSRNRSGQALLNRRQGGQALLIILLVLSVVLTIALSVVSRSITDITISRKEEEASRAFSAAEAGIEEALLIGADASGSLPGGGSFTASVSSIAEGSPNFNIPLALLSGETAPVWFVSHLSDGSLGCSSPGFPCFTGSSMKVCWGHSGTPLDDNTPALEVSIFYDPTFDGNFSDVAIARAAFDPYAVRPVPNDFSSASGTCAIEGSDYEFSANIDFATLPIPCTSSEQCLLFARIRMLYNNPATGGQAHPLGTDVSATGKLLPSQGSRIESLGTFEEANRQIEVSQLFSDLPPIFDFGAFSGSGGLEKP